MGLAEKLLAEGERPLLVLRPHVRRLARPALLLLVLAPVAASAAALVPPGAARTPARAVLAGLAALVMLRWVVWPFLLWWNTVYVLTDERIFERRGLVRRTGHDLPLQRVSDVMVAQSFGDRLLRCGSLRVVTEGGGEIVVADVPAVSRVQRALLAVSDDIHERLRAPHRWGEELDDVGEPGPWHAGEAPVDIADVHDEAAWGRDPDDADDADDADGAVLPGPTRDELRRRERESRRRLAEIQAQARRAPAPDSPLEDDGADPRHPVAAEPLAGPGSSLEDAPDDAPENVPENVPEDEPDEDAGWAADGAGGARILRFPRRP